MDKTINDKRCTFRLPSNIYKIIEQKAAEWQSSKNQALKRIILERYPDLCKQKSA